MNSITLLTGAISAISIASLWLSGRKWRWVWLLVLGNQALWCVFNVATENWGLFPLTFCYAVVAARNHVLWGRREASGQ